MRKLLELSLLVALLGALPGCHHEAAEAVDAGAVPVSVATVVKADVPERVEVTGELEALPGKDVKLGALQPGVLSQLLVAEGDRVERGQVLARLDPTQPRDAVSQAEANLAQARAQLENARAKRERANQAFKAGVAAAQEVDDARNQLASAESAQKAAEAALSTAHSQLGRSELRAPVAGVVAHLFMAVGEPADGSGKPIVEVADASQLDLNAHVPPDVAVRIHAGDAAELVVPGSARVIAGRVVAVSPVVDPTTGTVTVRVRVENGDGALKVGAIARASITVAVHRDALVVPSEALVPMDQEASAPGPRALAVERVEAGETVQRVEVRVLAQGASRTAIEGALKVGDRVVVEGAYALPNGTRVAARPATDGGAQP